MKIRNLFNFRPGNETLIGLAAFLACVLVNIAAGQLTGRPGFYLVYDGLLILGIGIAFPVWITAIRRRRPLSAIGITADHWPRAVGIGLLIAALSTGGRLMGAPVQFPPTSTLLDLVACMILSTLFEEVFFRGYLQTRLERSFGIIPAMLLSAACFALYHVGYSGLITSVSQLVTLFAVSLFFSIAFRLTNNVITSFIVNLPQAVLTFVVDPKFIAYRLRAGFDGTAAILAVVTTMLGLLLIAAAHRVYGRKSLTPASA